MTECGAKKRDGEPCGAPPIKGGKRCRRHGGAAPQVKRKAAERAQEAENRELMEKAVVTLGIKKDGVDPGQALLNEIAWTQAHVDWLRSKVQELDTAEKLTRGVESRVYYDRDGVEREVEANDDSSNPNAHALVWGQTEYRDKAGGEDAGQTVVEQATPNAWYLMYMKEREHLAKVCTMALKAGIEERRVRLAEQDGQKVAMVLQRILNALNLTPEQARMYPEIASRELHALAISMTEN